MSGYALSSGFEGVLVWKYETKLHKEMKKTNNQATYVSNVIYQYLNFNIFLGLNCYTTCTSG